MKTKRKIVLVMVMVCFLLVQQIGSGIEVRAEAGRNLVHIEPLDAKLEVLHHGVIPVNNGAVIILANDSEDHKGYMLKLDAQGNQLWRHEHENRYQSSLKVGNVFYAEAGGKVFKYDFDGQILATYPLNVDGFNGFAMEWLQEGQIIIGGMSDLHYGMVCLDINTGRVLWNKTTVERGDTFRHPNVTDKFIYFYISEVTETQRLIISPYKATFEGTFISCTEEEVEESYLETLATPESNELSEMTIYPGFNETENVSEYLKYEKNEYLLKSNVEFDAIIVYSENTAVAIYRDNEHYNNPYIIKNYARSKENYSDYIFGQQNPEIKPLEFDYTLIGENLDDAQIKSIMNAEIKRISEEQKEHADALDALANFTEYAIQQSAVVTIQSVGDVLHIQKSAIEVKIAEANTLKTTLEKTIAEAGIVLNRKIGAGIKVKSDMDADHYQIKLDQSLATGEAIQLTVVTAAVEVSMNLDQFQGEIDELITIQIDKIEASVTGSLPNALDSEQLTTIGSVLQDNQLVKQLLTAQQIPDSYSIRIKKGEQANLENKLTLGMAAVSDDTDYNCVFIKRADGNEEALGGSYKKATNKLEIKTNESGTYFVKKNKKSFQDLSNLDDQTKQAIEILAAKGMISGNSATTFNPNGSISRAEFTKIIIRALFLYDASAKNTFTDVNDTAWYAPYIASSKKAGLIGGYPDNTFIPLNVISKQEMVKICAASLYEQKGYIYPIDPNKYLSKYKDNIPSWVTQYLALADREGIVASGTTGQFNGKNGVKRSDAALILYRLFKRL